MFSNGLAAHSRLDLDDVDLPHIHHRFECALRHIATLGHRLGQDARRDLPRQAPFVLAPATRTLCAAVTDDRVPITVGLHLVVGGNLKGERFAVRDYSGLEIVAKHGPLRLRSSL
jgi:hypothetical protein